MTRNGIWANEACPIAWWLNNEPTNQTARQREHVECTRTTKPFNRQRRCCLVLSITSVRISSASPFAFFALFSLHYSDIKAKRKNFSFSFVKYWNRAQFVRMFAALFRHIFICISFFLLCFPFIFIVAWTHCRCCPRRQWKTKRRKNLSLTTAALRQFDRCQSTIDGRTLSRGEIDSRSFYFFFVVVTCFFWVWVL